MGNEFSKLIQLGRNRTGAAFAEKQEEQLIPSTGREQNPETPDPNYTTNPSVASLEKQRNLLSHHKTLLNRVYNDLRQVQIYKKTTGSLQIEINSAIRNKN